MLKKAKKINEPVTNANDSKAKKKSGSARFSQPGNILVQKI